jgi:hypothetical protein
MAPPTPQDVDDLVAAAAGLTAVSASTPYVGGGCPYCWAEGGEHRSHCQIEELDRRLQLFRTRIGGPIDFEENYIQVRDLVAVAREVVDALDDWDPAEFRLCSLAVSCLKEKLAPFTRLFGEHYG